MPVRDRRRVRIQRIHAVALRADKHHVVDAARYAQVFHVKRLGINLPVHVVSKKFAEIIRVDVERRQNGFGCVRAGARQIAVLSKDIYGAAVRKKQRGSKENERNRGFCPLGLSKRRMNSSFNA